MSYATFDDLIDRFTEAELIMLTDPSGAGEVYMPPIERALSDAAAEINSALRGRYALPMSPVDPLLAAIACDIARLALHADRPTEAVKENAKVARELLSAIAAGKRVLAAAPAAAAEAVTGLVEMVSGRRKTPFVG